MKCGMFRLALALATAGSLTFTVGAGCAQDDKHEEGDSASVEAQQLPSAVRAGFDRAFPGATIREVEKETYPDGTVHWEVEFTTADGKPMEKEFDQAGKLLADH